MDTTFPNNPYIFLKQDQLSINCGKTNHNIAIKNIAKIHISKHKSSYLENMIGQLLQVPDTDYLLNIHTHDQGSLKIKINPLERFFCIRLVSVLRKQLHPQQMGFNQ